MPRQKGFHDDIGSFGEEGDLVLDLDNDAHSFRLAGKGEGIENFDKLCLIGCLQLDGLFIPLEDVKPELLGELDQSNFVG